MIIMKIKAGLGNQMFQYACGRALSLRNGERLLLDLSQWESGEPTDRPYGLDEFKITADIADGDDIFRLKYPFGKIVGKVLKKIDRIFHKDYISFYPKILNIVGDAYLDGYWQSEQYFKDFSKQIAADFQLNNPSAPFKTQEKTVLSSKCPVSLHIRRGDNAYNPPSIQSFGCPGLDYYYSALKALESAIQNNRLGPIELFVFTDDVTWVKENLKTNYQVTIISGTGLTAPEEISLMSLCKHNIISNSTFSWWGAWLNKNPDKIVIAPKRWALKRISAYKDIIPLDWIRI